MAQDAMDRKELDEQYRQIMDQATKEAAGYGFVPTPVAPAGAFFFPWERSPFRANGSTSAESGNGH